ETAAKPKTDLYREVLPAINSGTISLLDHPRSVAQLCALERRVARGGKDSIDHPPNAHDDLGNCIAGLFSLAKYGGRYKYPTSMDWVSGPPADPAAQALRDKEFRDGQFWRHIMTTSGYFNGPGRW